MPTGTATGGLQVRLPEQLGGLANPHGRGAMPSSAMPSQSLSQPSQISGDGTQPQLIRPSSLRPSQSSSLPLHTSAVGHASGLPHFTIVSSTPAWQLLSTLSQISFGS